MSQVLNGKKIAAHVLANLKKQITRVKVKPGLAVILVGRNEASRLYVSLKEKAAAKVGIKFYKFLLAANISEQKIIKLIKLLNLNKKINGIIVQLPLPKKFNTDKIIYAINPEKDADGFHPKNIERLEKGDVNVLPVLTQVVIKFLRHTRQNFIGKTACLIANSDKFFEPFKAYLPRHFGLKIICAKAGDRKLKTKTQKADLLIVAVGKPRFITADYVKKGAIVIDIGITRKGGQVLGDVNFDTVKNKTSFITPVPGGVGPLTVAFLLHNTYLLSKLKNRP